MIEHLPILIPDSDRAERTIARCHRQLALMDKTRYTMERNTLLGFGVIYMSSVAFAVLQVLMR
jgi:hypothetical protein